MDISKLDEGLANLRGLDLEKCEAQERAAGNAAFLISMTSSFQARLGAMALKVPVADVRELPLKDYRRVINKVAIFLGKLDSEETTSEA